MTISNADDARAWLRSWGGRPRRGILIAVIDGLELSMALGEDEKLRAAIQVLRGALPIESV